MPEVLRAPPIDDKPLPPRQIDKRHQRPVTAQPKAEAPPRRQSLFSIVTSAFKPVPPVAEITPAAVAQPAARPVSVAQPADDLSVDQGGIDPDLEIPTFLRRQGTAPKV